MGRILKYGIYLACVLSLLLFFFCKNNQSEKEKKVQGSSVKSLGNGTPVKIKTIEDTDTTKVSFELLEQFPDSLSFVKAHPGIESDTRKHIIEKAKSIQFYDPLTGRILKTIPKKDNGFTRKELAFFARKTGETILKKIYGYQISDDCFLLERCHTIPFVDTIVGLDGGPRNFNIYNRSGDMILHVPEDNNILFSPDHEHIIFYTCQGSSFPIFYPKHTLQFYSATGKLLKKYVFDTSQISSMIEADFTGDGKYVVVIGVKPVGTTLIYNSSGVLLKTIHGLNIGYSNSFKTYVSKNADYSLASLIDSLILIDNTKSKELWGKACFRASQAFFAIDKGCIVAEVEMKKGMLSFDPKCIRIYSFKSGKILDEIKNATILAWQPDRFYVKKEHHCFVYHLKSS